MMFLGGVHLLYFIATALLVDFRRNIMTKSLDNIFFDLGIPGKNVRISYWILKLAKYLRLVFLNTIGGCQPGLRLF